MIGEVDMTWTAICQRDGLTSATSFHFHPDAEDALNNIRKILEADGFSVVGIVKGDHSGAFYGVNLETGEIISGKN
jgi:hypothetical protein|tara:strand:+ start:5593 stop:5820 length:228 start_codon:yes stop_codon:yes gene_type:complete